jgi:hypothetical protein
MGTKRTALMDQFLSMFFQLVTKHVAENPPPPSPVFSQVQEVPMEIVNAVSDSMDEWKEIAVAQHLGETAYQDAEWIACSK